ncbi:DUF4192 family protein [Microbacterium chocolatum]|uniref:DUF4192 family protein n=1 Tax=Microbacterium aurantiacum TaxID=162393 RepID=UPI00338DCAAC
MTTTVTVGDPAGFLSLVPHLMGFAPSRSLVVVPFSGGRSLGVMRVDLPGGEHDAVDRVSATVVGMVCRVSGADGLVPIVYTEERFADAGGMPHRALLDAVARRADACGLAMPDALVVAADGWGSTTLEPLPPEGFPLERIDVDAATPSGALAPRADGVSGAELPAVTAAERERIAHALTGLHRALRILCGTGAVDTAHANGSAGGDADTGRDVDDLAWARVDPASLMAACALDDVPTLYEDALDWDPTALDAVPAATLLWCLARPSLRDVALVQWCSDIDGGDDALEAQRRWEAGEEYPPHLAMHLWGEGAQPQPRRLVRALEVVRRLAACAPPDAAPGALAVCAWLAWALGRSTHAEVLARQALDLDPEHGLAEIVLSFVAAGHLPDWAFRAAERR